MGGVTSKTLRFESDGLKPDVGENLEKPLEVVDIRRVDRIAANGGRSHDERVYYACPDSTYRPARESGNAPVGGFLQQRS
jgi:hypothetical protein